MMKTRRTNCIKDVNRYVNSFAKGSQGSRDKRRRTLYSLIDDLLTLGLLPNQLKELKDEYIHDLVAHWRSNKLSTITIVNRVGILRKLMATMYDIKIPDNKSLDIQDRQPSKLPFRSADRSILDLVHHPVTKTILAFQIYFGLTKSESAHIILDSALQDDDLFISSKLSSNGKDRFVPIVSKTQKEVIDYRYEVLGKHRKLTDRIPEYLLLALVNAEIHDCGYDVMAPFRRIYAQERLASLCKTKTKKLATKMLVEELGYLNYQKLKAGLLA